MKIYTKTGDQGQTSLLDNEKISKDNIRVESYGTIDELNSFLGLAKNYVTCMMVYDLIEDIQNKLFVLSSNLAIKDASDMEYRICEKDVIFLENNIDKYISKLDDSVGFVVPGSGKASGYMHVCRTICRRAERRIVTLNSDGEVDSVLIQYINRLSDLIYVLARYLEKVENKTQYGS